MKSEKFGFGDIFCGCGGLSLGFKRAGFIPVFGIDSDQYACNLYEKNISPRLLIKEDVRNVNPTELPPVDILLGCPPCQGFSKMNGRGRYTKKEDARNNLVRIFVDFALALKPPILFFENVPPLGRDFRFRELLENLSKMYNLHYRILDLGSYGGGKWFPERPAVHRRRIVMLGVRTDLEMDPATLFPEPFGDPLPIGIILERIKNPVNYRILKGKLAKIASYLRPGMSRNELPEKIKRKYFYPCWLKEKKSFTDVFMRINPSRPLPYVSSGFLDPDRGPFLHPYDNRGYAVEEILSAMSFPENYKVDLPKRKAADLIGNAFPPQAAYAFAVKIGNVLSRLNHVLR